MAVEVVKDQRDPKRSSKCHKSDFLPSVRPSLVSLILIFFCGYLWMKTAAAKDHLLAVERQLDMISKEFQAGKSSIQPTTGFTAQPQSGKNSFSTKNNS